MNQVILKVLPLFILTDTLSMLLSLANLLALSRLRAITFMQNQPEPRVLFSSVPPIEEILICKLWDINFARHRYFWLLSKDKLNLMVNCLQTFIILIDIFDVFHVAVSVKNELTIWVVIIIKVKVFNDKPKFKLALTLHY